MIGHSDLTPTVAEGARVTSSAHNPREEQP